MAEVSAEMLAERAFQLNLIDSRELEIIRSELGGGEVPQEAFRGVALRKELLTNYQYEKLVKGETSGFFYGNYKVLYLTGTGTFARVYRAAQKDTGKIFAVKVLRRRHRDKPFELESFLKEGELGLQLRHPNIVPIYEVSNNKVEPFLVMDFIEGQNLRDFVKVRKKLDVATSVRLTTEILNGLAYAATKGIFHRDLKLSNALVTSRGTAKLVDFGLYNVRAGNDLAETQNPRTVDYVALEKVSGVKRDDHRSDIYFTGCMFYNMLCGQTALVETRDKHLRQSEARFRDVKPIHIVDPTLPRSVVSIVQRAMELNVERRYQTPNEMLFDLQLAAKRLAAGDDTLPVGPAAGNGRLDGVTRTVMIVEAKVEMQNMLRDRLKKHGYRVLVISDPLRAINRFDGEQKAADLVFFSAMDLGASAVEAFNQFGIIEATKNVPAILFLDEDQQHLAGQASLAPHRVLLKMPLTVRTLRETLRVLLNEEPESQEGAPA